MAKKNHRKLFPSLASETNKTLDCSLGICDPICPYNCYQEPDYYTISPQLAPWSSPSPSPCPSIFAFYQPSEKSSSSLDAITIVIVTGAVIAILLTGFFLVAKYFAESENRVNQESYQSDDNDTVQEEEFQDREQVDHPIWLIRTTGLNQSIINSITICNYKRGDGLIERTDCPVCLNEFEEDESLRLLPKCNHAFHISCIDTWLKSHTNCPLCRAGITISVVTTPRCSGPVDVIITPGGGSGSGLENDGVGEDGQIENRVESEVKERDDSDNTDPSSDVRIEIYGFGNEINRDLEEIDGDGSETETKDKAGIFEECMDPNGEDSIDSLSLTKTHIGNGDFPGKSCENQSQELTRSIGDEASCSEENGGHNNVRSRRRFDSIDSGELNDETSFGDPGKDQSGISSNTLKTTGSSSVSSRLNKSKSSIFPL
ncbi:RING-H2 finger protein ATL54 [Cardamine amara subsp. amara]|uniref:RING-type E3 ubiquitin transferase n=1 Tax=Cardamine amara subsp. amara TaxID=228776 RepID=A0ABD1BRP4_CARAN